MNDFKEENAATIIVKNTIVMNALIIFFGVKISMFFTGLKPIFFNPINMQYIKIVLANVILKHVWYMIRAKSAVLTLFGITVIVITNIAKYMADNIIKGMFSCNEFINNVLTLSTKYSL